MSISIIRSIRWKSFTAILAIAFVALAVVQNNKASAAHPIDPNSPKYVYHYGEQQAELLEQLRLLERALSPNQILEAATEIDRIINEAIKAANLNPGSLEAVARADGASNFGTGWYIIKDLSGNSNPLGGYAHPASLLRTVIEWGMSTDVAGSISTRAAQLTELGAHEFAGKLRALTGATKPPGGPSTNDTFWDEGLPQLNGGRSPSSGSSNSNGGSQQSGGGSSEKPQPEPRSHSERQPGNSESGSGSTGGSGQMQDPQEEQEEDPDTPDPGGGGGGDTPPPPDQPAPPDNPDPPSPPDNPPPPPDDPPAPDPTPPPDPPPPPRNDPPPPPDPAPEPDNPNYPDPDEPVSYCPADFEGSCGRPASREGKSPAVKGFMSKTSPCGPYSNPGADGNCTGGKVRPGAGPQTAVTKRVCFASSYDPDSSGRCSKGSGRKGSYGSTMPSIARANRADRCGPYANPGPDGRCSTTVRDVADRKSFVINTGG